LRACRWETSFASISYSTVIPILGFAARWSNGVRMQKVRIVTAIF